jgi:hypothetical protein
MRVSAEPARTRRWHLECRDRVVREGQEQVRAALEIMSKATLAANHLAKSIDELQAILGVYR